MMRRALLAAIAPFALAGCGLHPLYAGGSGGPVATALAGIEVAPIAGKTGWLMTNALDDRLARGSATPRYRLDIRIDQNIIGLGIRRDNSVTRERVSLRARYQLVDLSDQSVLLDATAGSDEGIDVVQSGYATIAAEDSSRERLATVVADQIVARIALYAQRRHDGEAPIPVPAAPAVPATAAPASTS